MPITEKEKKTAIEKIIHKLHSNKCGYVFGGFYRDQLTSQSSSEFDFWTLKHKRQEALKLILDLGLRVVAQEPEEDLARTYINYANQKKFQKRRYTVSTQENDFVINLDFFYSEGFDSHFDVLPVSTDVDSLYFDLNQNKITTKKGVALENVLATLVHKKISVDENLITADRIEHLLRLGFTCSQKTIFKNVITQVTQVKNSIKEERNGDISMANETAPKATLDSFVQTMATDAKLVLGDAAYRSTSRLIVKAVKDGLVKMLQSKSLGDFVPILSAYLDTEIGEAIISAVVGYGVNALPADVLKKYPQLKKLSHEFKVEGVSKSYDVVVAEATKFILPGLLEALNGSESFKAISRLEVEEEEAEEETATAKKKTVGKKD